MIQKDNCGCVIERKYASDYLLKRFYQGSKGREICKASIDGSRSFTLYLSKEGILSYKASECPILIITLEALCEAFEEHKGNVNRESLVSKVKSIKGFQFNTLSEKITELFLECLKVI
jgi:hypothetical protein